MSVGELISKNYVSIQHDLRILSIVIKCVSTKLDNDAFLDQNKKYEYVVDLFNLLEHYQNLYDTTGDISYNNILENNYYSIVEGIRELKDDLLPLLKITTVLFLENLKKDDLEVFQSMFDVILVPFANINDACSFVYYHGTKDVTSFTRKFLEYYRLKGYEDRLIKIDYFEKYSNVITLKNDEWPRLYQNLNMAMKLVANNDEEYQDLKEAFIKLQVYYFIAMTGDANV